MIIGTDFDLSSDESLVVGPGGDGIAGAIDPITNGIVLDSQSFDIYRYVTDSGAQVRRIVVEVRWESRGLARTFWTTTQIAEVGTS